MTVNTDLEKVINRLQETQDLGQGVGYSLGYNASVDAGLAELRTLIHVFDSAATDEERAVLVQGIRGGLRDGRADYARGAR